MELKRTFHAVGQGAFYSECFQDKNGREIFNVVYDCGTSSSNNYLFKAIDDFAKEKNSIDFVFVSHFHGDHVNGINRLLGQCKAKKIVIPLMHLATFVEQYIFNIIDSGTVVNAANEFIANYYLGEDERIVRIPLFGNEGGDSEDGIPYLNIENYQSKVTQKLGDFWEYIPFNIRDNRAIDFLNSFMKDYPDLYDAFAKMDRDGIDTVNAYFSVKEKVDEMETYYKVFFHNLNESSMAVVSIPIENLCQNEAFCLYTGDYPFRVPRFYEQLRDYYNAQWNEIGTMQVAHHGASNDNPQPLFDRKRDYVVCYGIGNRYGHPGVNTIENIIGSKSQPKLVTQWCNYCQSIVF